MAEQKTSGGAVTSLVLGILSFACIGPLAGIPAIIVGHVSLSNIKKSDGELTGGGLAVAGLILGYVNLLIFIIYILCVTVFGVFGDTIRSEMEGAVMELERESMTEQGTGQ